MSVNQRVKEGWESFILKHKMKLCSLSILKFFNKEDIPWVALIWESYYEAGSLPSMAKKGSFWWKDILKLLDKFKGMARVNINNAKSCLLWSDLWNDKVTMLAYLELYSFVKSKSTILAEARTSDIILFFSSASLPTSLWTA